MNESDLRSELRREAERFDPAPGWLDALTRRTRRPRRRLPRPATALSVMTAAAVAATVYVATLGPSADTGQPPKHEATPTTTDGTPRSAVTMQLVGYQAPVHGTLPRGLEEHLACMRDHGYAIPDPEWTGNGWMLTLDDARGIGFGTLRWKRTVFITCALTRPGGDGLEGLRDELLHPRIRAARGDDR
jgi:hypothetical protein